MSVFYSWKDLNQCSPCKDDALPTELSDRVFLNLAAAEQVGRIAGKLA